MTSWPLAVLIVMMAAPAGAVVQDMASQNAEATPPLLRWDDDSIKVLRQWAESAAEDALAAPDLGALDMALAAGDRARGDAAATDIALSMARQHLLGALPAPARWDMDDADRRIDLKARLAAALADGAQGLDHFLSGLRPRHPDYAALRAALAGETDRERRITLARNMERWRWLPLAPGPDFVLVNAAAYEAQLWRQGVEVGRWKVIIGKTRTPTPMFAATIRGIILNPWWEIPASIVAENRGRFPSGQGYVRAGTRWRQAPGPDNALGQVKLDMPNAHSVYLHDTPAKSLFSRQFRAFSHGCIRVGDALGLAKALVADTHDPADIDALMASGETVTLPLAAPLPIYIAYFTAGTDASGTVTYRRDIYGLDKRSAMTAVTCDA